MHDHSESTTRVELELSATGILAMTIETLPLPPFDRGEIVKVKGVRGTFKVTGENKDGSIAVYGGPSGRERF